MTERDAVPVDPDVDLHVPAVRAELPSGPVRVLGAISAGGVLGALARYGLQTVWPHPAGGFPWATFVINVTGCLLIGALMVVVSGRPLMRLFLGVGGLGGYTTFSTYVVDIQRAAAWVALCYLALTLVGALLAVWAGAALTRAAVLPKAGAPR